jgi:hypothetical protein
MARRKQATQTAIESADFTEDAAPPAVETAAAALEASPEERPAKQWRQKPWPVTTVNLGSYKIVPQESRPEKRPREAGEDAVRSEPWQMQIRFGDGSKADMPSEAVLDYIKSHTKTVTTRDGDEFEVRAFRWNARDRAWGTAIDFNAPHTSRLKAEKVFKEVVATVKAERGLGQSIDSPF